MDLYSEISSNAYVTGWARWYKLPTGPKETTLVVSVTAEEAIYWIISYTLLISLTFIALATITTSLVLAFFPLKRSANRHAMLVAYFNANRPPAAILAVWEYLNRSLFNTRRHGRRAVDWDTLWPSLALIMISAILVGGDVVSRYIFGGRQLVVAHCAPANPQAIFYPARGEELQALPGGAGLFNAFKRVRGSAMSQAMGRVELARNVLKDRVRFNAVLYQNSSDEYAETGAKFTYHYSMTGYEMGLRDAHDLTYTVFGQCETAYQHVYYDPTPDYDADDWYPYFGDFDDEDYVTVQLWSIIAPRLNANADTDPEMVSKVRQTGRYRYSITPHTAYKRSNSTRKNDPWYVTEPKPPPDEDEFTFMYRVKRGRPPLECFQSDTYEHKGTIVNHVDKLIDLPDLKISPFIRDVVFGREFGVPVILSLITNLNYASVASSLYYNANQRSLDAERANTTEDMERLAHLAFVYSREVVRNTVLLYPTLNNIGLENVAMEGSAVPDEYADIFVESSDVVALSVHILIATPCVCALLWLLILVWTQTLNQPPKEGKKSNLISRHNSRYIGLQATQLYRCLDEQITKEHRWSGTRSTAPYIRELDLEPTEQLPDVVVESPPTSPGSRGAYTEVTNQTPQFEAPAIQPRQSRFVETNFETVPMPMPANRKGHGWYRSFFGRGVSGSTDEKKHLNSAVSNNGRMARE